MNLQFWAFYDEKYPPAKVIDFRFSIDEVEYLLEIYEDGERLKLWVAPNFITDLFLIDVKETINGI